MPTREVAFCYTEGILSKLQCHRRINKRSHTHLANTNQTDTNALTYQQEQQEHQKHHNKKQTNKHPFGSSAARFVKVGPDNNFPTAFPRMCVCMDVCMYVRMYCMYVPYVCVRSFFGRASSLPPVLLATPLRSERFYLFSLNSTTPPSILNVLLPRISQSGFP